MKTTKKTAQLLKRPLRDPAELEQLSAWLAERRAVLRERGRIALAIAALLLVLTVVIVATDHSAPGSDLLILPAMLILAAAVATPFAARRWWAGPRLLAVQRRLLQDRGQSGIELAEPATVLAELEERIAHAEALLAGDRTPSGPPGVAGRPSGAT